MRSNVEQLAVLKLLITKLTKANRANQVVTKITKPNPNYKSIPAAISTAENHGRPVITENHEGGSFLLLWDLKNWIFVLEQKSGYSSQATSTSSLWRLPLEWSPVRFSNEDNSGSSRWQPTPSKSARSISTVSNTFNGRRSAFLLADTSWSLISDQGKIGNNSVSEVVDFAHNAPCTVHLCFEINRKHLKHCFLVEISLLFASGLLICMIRFICKKYCPIGPSSL